jgi:hypothetical protein
MMNKLFNRQVDQLQDAHFNILYWATLAEGQEMRYNLTNVFDDLKGLKITRTKQSAMAFVEMLRALCFIEVRDESNRKNLYITEFGGQALEKLIVEQNFKVKTSSYLEN